MTVGGVQLLYQLNRANGHIDSDPLVVHALKPKAVLPLAGLPDLGYVARFHGLPDARSLARSDSRPAEP